MTFYVPRNITSNDQLLFDAAGNCVGIQPGGTSKQATFGQTAQEKAAFDSLVSGGWKQGYRTVIFGDSGADTYQTVASGLPGSYDQNTGVLTLTITGHQQAVGWFGVIWNRTSATTIKGRRLPVASVIDANTLTFNYGPGLTDVPSTLWFCRLEAWQSGQAWFSWVQYLSGHRFQVVNNGAQSGDTIFNALDRLDADCTAFAPEVIFYQALGYNDTSLLVDEETIHAAQRLVIDKLLATGAKVVMLGHHAIAAGDGRSTVGNMSRIRSLNRRQREYVRDKPGVIWFDTYRRTVDPSNTTGLAFVNLIRTADKVHFSNRGGRLIAGDLWAQIAPAFPSDASSLPTSTADGWLSSALTLTGVARAAGVVTATATANKLAAGERYKLSGGSEAWNEYVTLTAVTANTVSFRTAVGANGDITGTIKIGKCVNMHDNPLLTVTTGGQGIAGSGTSSGGFANNIRVENISGAPSHVGLVVPRSDGFGNNQRVTITGSSSTDQVGIGPDYNSYQVDLPAQCKAGRTYTIEADISLTGMANAHNITEIRFVMSATVGGVVYYTHALNGYEPTGQINTDQSAVNLKSAPFVMPAGAITTVKWAMVFKFSAAGMPFVLEIGRIGLIEAE